MGNFRCVLTQTDAFLPGGDPFPRRGRAEVPPPVSTMPISMPVSASSSFPDDAPASGSGRLVEEAAERRRVGYDIGPDPVYFHKPSAEPRPELVGTAWFPERGRGRVQRRFVPPKGPNTNGAPAGGAATGALNEEMPPAGIDSEYLRSTRNQTRTGLKLTRDCWGNVIP